MRKRILCVFAVVAIVAGLLFGFTAITMCIGLFGEPLDALGWIFAASMFLFVAMLAMLLFRSGVQYFSSRTKEQAIDVSVAACFVFCVTLLSLPRDSDDLEAFGPDLPFAVLSIVLAYSAFRAIKAFVVEPEYKK